jgi:hypothetical protein
MGVADGVYSWREQGIDSGHLAQALMSTARNMVRAGIEDVFKGTCSECELPFICIMPIIGSFGVIPRSV